jgi:hypothetical protein
MSEDTEVYQPVTTLFNGGEDTDNAVRNDLFMRLQVAWLEYQVELQKALRLQDQMQAQTALVQAKDYAWNVTLDQARKEQDRPDGEGIDFTHRIWIAPPKGINNDA